MGDIIHHELRSRLASAMSLAQAGQWADAEQACRDLLAENPALVEANYLLGVVYQNSRQTERAIPCYEAVLQQVSTHADALNNLGTIYESLNRRQDALEYYRRAAGSNTGHVLSNYNLGRMLRLAGQPAEAATYLQAALGLSPDSVQILHELGLSHKALGNLDRALHYLQLAHSRSPSDPGICNVTGNVYQSRGELEQAINAYNDAIRLNPAFASAWNNLGSALLARGEITAALASYRKAAGLRPEWVGAASNVLLAENYLYENAADLFEDHRRFGASLENLNRRLTPVGPQQRGRKIRIGYISPDFRYHSVAFFLKGLFLNHDRTQFEIICFSDVVSADGMTQELKSLATDWHNISGLTDAEVFQSVRQSKIDILVDLAGHTANNRLAVFAMQAAAVQVSYLGYPNTTGLETVQYRFTDALADPAGSADRLHTEKLIRLPGCFLCYTPPEEAPASDEPACDRHGYITYGSFNVLAKLSDRCADVWAAILTRQPGARLVLKSAGLQDKSTRDLVYSRFSDRHVDPSRLELLARTTDFRSHMSLYNHIDISLDTFPYNGTTTTCESLWMGVPVVTLGGNRHAGRVGASLLHQVGLDDCVAGDVEAYIAKALRLADDRNRLHSLRGQLRQTMTDSPLCDAAALTSAIEAQYKSMLS